MSLEDTLPFGESPTKRFVSEGGEGQLYKKHSIGKTGFVELVDYMGGDGTVGRVATLGHGRSVFPENPDQRDFIHHLANKGIYEPFSSAQLKFSVQSPILAALSLVYDPRASLNEYSGRYSVMLDSSLEPGEHFVGRSNADQIINVFRKNRERTTQNYARLIDIDMARELARSGLGIDNDTQYFWKVDLRSLSDFVRTSRKKFDLVHPTREYVEAIADVAQQFAPHSWEALMSERDVGITLTPPTDDDIVDSGLQSSSWGEHKTKRVTVPALEERLFEVDTFLDHGQFQAVDYMGNDSSFAEAARTSYGRGTKTLQDDITLVRSLVRDAHTSPIEMAELAFESRSPAFSDPRQAGRHRTLDKHGFMGSHPIGSQFYVPNEGEFKYQDRLNRQGRGKEMDEEDLRMAQELFVSDKEAQIAAAQELRALGASEEVVRLSKGVGFYTSMWRTGDTHNLGNFLRLRLDSHAQMEVRELAEKVRGTMQLHTPHALNAITTYRIEGMGLSEREVRVMQAQGMIREDLDTEDLSSFKGGGFVIRNKKTGEQGLGREGEAFKAKLKRLRRK